MQLSSFIVKFWGKNPTFWNICCFNHWNYEIIHFFFISKQYYVIFCTLRVLLVHWKRVYKKTLDLAPIINKTLFHLWLFTKKKRERKMATTTYKLHYFAWRGCTEGIRLLFTYAKVPFEDVRYKIEEFDSHRDGELKFWWEFKMRIFVKNKEIYFKFLKFYKL